MGYEDTVSVGLKGNQMIFLIPDGLACPNLELYPGVTQNPNQYIWDDSALKNKQTRKSHKDYITSEGNKLPAQMVLRSKGMEDSAFLTMEHSL